MAQLSDIHSATPTSEVNSLRPSTQNRPSRRFFLVSSSLHIPAPIRPHAEASIDVVRTAITLGAKNGATDATMSGANLRRILSSHVNRRPLRRVHATYACRAPIRDVLDDILHHVFTQMTSYKNWNHAQMREVSKASLISHRWARTLRPILFRKIELQTPEDVQFLLKILRSPMSGWLREHIAELTVHFFRSAPYNAVSLQAAKDVLRLTPSIGCVNWYTMQCSELSPWRERPFFRALTSVRVLLLQNAWFPSLSGLFRLVGSMDELRNIDVRDVKWDTTTVDADPWQMPPSCRAAFKNIEDVFWHRCTDNRAIGWVHAARSVRRGYTMRRGEEEVVPNVDVVAIVQLIYTFFERAVDRGGLYTKELASSAGEWTPSNPS